MYFILYSAMDHFIYVLNKEEDDKNVKSR